MAVGQHNESRAVLWHSRPAFPILSLDRKSTRLNSSHSQISYAVFCLKKKNTLIRSVHSQSYSFYTLRLRLTCLLRRCIFYAGPTKPVISMYIRPVHSTSSTYVLFNP